MKLKLFFIITQIFTLSCYSTQSYDNSTEKEKPAVVLTTAGQVSETIKIYGLIKTESDNVYIIANRKSKSMVTYAVTGLKKSELAKNTGKYASVSGVLTDKKTWSGTIEVKQINSIDDSPDLRKEKILKFIKKKPGS
jgi:indole-3-glycerol phosphate synthase